MRKKQLGQRNCSDEQKTYLIGKEYEARKMSEAFHGNQYVGGAQNEHDQNSGKRTAEIIAEEHGVGKESVKRAEHFAHGLDAADAISERRMKLKSITLGTTNTARGSKTDQLKEEQPSA